MDKFQREKESFRFAFGGMKTNASADALAPNKYAVAINVRGVGDDSTQTRPGHTQVFQLGTLAIPTDIRAYTALNTDNLPRILARDSLDRIWLDTGVQVGTLAGAGASSGTTFIPFRPNASPIPYMYAANGVDYQKFSAPSGVSDVVIARKVGIAEPQAPPDAVITNLRSNIFATPSYISGGTASSASAGLRVSDTAGAVIKDPITGAASYSIQVGTAIKYQRGMFLLIGGASNYHIVQDVFPALPVATNISGIFYFSGTTGRCIVVPSNLAAGSSVGGASIYAQGFVSLLRRGALIKIGTEVCMVWSVTAGPDGSVAVETSTVANHTALETMTNVPSIQVLPAVPAVPASGMSIVASSVAYAVTIGVGTEQASAAGGVPFSFGGASVQPDDYISIGVLVDNLANLTEMRILFDVGDGTFTQDYYYYSVRPSDIAAATTNAATQLAALETLIQRAEIDASIGTSARNQQQISTSAQTAPGSGQWTQIVFPIRALTRVGNDQTKSLQNSNGIRFSWNASGTLSVAHDQVVAVVGGYSPDVGDVGAPYRYRVRPRAKDTGVIGNPSPATRYGVNPRRAAITVNLPSAAYDAQIDTWDIFRYGGSITSWRYVGSTPTTNSQFTDIYGDEAVQAGSALDFDNFEPWPSVYTSFPIAPAVIVGTVATVTVNDLDDLTFPNILRFLPGTLVQIGTQNVYTLWARPSVLSATAGGLSGPTTTYLLQFAENAGVPIGPPPPSNIPEPLLARQSIPYMWGPDAEGTVFACGDPIHPSTVYFSKNYAPDAAPDRYNVEVSAPSEPLLGGEILDGLSFVASTEHWWRLYPQGTAYLNPQNRVQRYTPVLQPLQRGLAAPFGHCNDGTSLFWWAKDGIWSSARGSLTDGDLYNLFPHDGVPGVDVVYGGATVKSPDYSRAGTFRLAYCNHYLYAVYQDTDGTYRCLTYDTRREAWVVDAYAFPVSAVYHVEQPEGSSGALNPVLLLGTRDSSAIFRALVSKQSPNANDNGSPIVCVLATKEFDGGDIRAGEQWGDLYLDSRPAAVGLGGLTLTPMFLGQAAAAVKTIPQSTARTQQPVSVGGELTTNFLGCLLNWTDDFSTQALPTVLYAWQPSLLAQPEITADRISNWDDGGSPGAKWVQGFVMEADTFNVAKGLAVQDSDTLAVHSFTPAVVHNGQSQFAYSFDAPFIAHMLRIKPLDQLPWRFWDVKWIAEPTPETARTWKTQPSTHGLQGYMHVRQVSIAYASTDIVTLAISAYDGVSPASVALPSTGGAVKKVVVPLTFNKGQLYTYGMTSPAPFQVFQAKCEVLIGQWGRSGGYVSRPLVGGEGGDEAKI